VEAFEHFLRDPTVWVLAGGASVVLFIGSLLVLPHAVARLPADYFVREASAGLTERSSFVARVARNGLGAVLLLMGVAMLVLPGQGVLTLLVGLVLIDFPGKQRLERRLARQPHVRRTLQWMRRRAQRAPLVFEPTDIESTAEAGDPE